MRFSFSEEQEELRRVVRRFLEETSPIGETRRLMETPEGFEPGVWKQLSQELALPGVQIPEAYGGQGFGFVELGVVLEEMGRALYCGPYFASVVLAANAILNAGDEAQKQALLPGIASGETLATLARTLVVLAALFQPAVPAKMAELCAWFGLDRVPTLAESGSLAVAGRRVSKGAPLFPKVDPAELA